MCLILHLQVVVWAEHPGREKDEMDLLGPEVKVQLLLPLRLVSVQGSPMK